jgi:hypothetical protein
MQGKTLFRDVLPNPLTESVRLHFDGDLVSLFPI